MADIKIYTTRWSTDCDQAKEFLNDEGIFYEEIDIEKTPAAARLVEQFNGGKRIVPTFDAVRDLVRTPAVQQVPELSAPVLDFDPYDRLLGRETAHG